MKGKIKRKYSRTLVTLSDAPRRATVDLDIVNNNDDVSDDGVTAHVSTRAVSTPIARRIQTLYQPKRSSRLSSGDAHPVYIRLGGGQELHFNDNIEALELSPTDDLPPALGDSADATHDDADDDAGGEAGADQSDESKRARKYSSNIKRTPSHHKKIDRYRASLRRRKAEQRSKSEPRFSQQQALKLCSNSTQPEDGTKSDDDVIDGPAACDVAAASGEEASQQQVRAAGGRRLLS